MVGSVWFAQEEPQQARWVLLLHDPDPTSQHPFLAGLGLGVQGHALKSVWAAELTASAGPRESPGDQNRASFLPRGFVAAPSESLGYNGIIIVKIRIAARGGGASWARKPRVRASCSPG